MRLSRLLTLYICLSRDSDKSTSLLHNWRVFCFLVCCLLCNGIVFNCSSFQQIQMEVRIKQTGPEVSLQSGKVTCCTANEPSLWFFVDLFKRNLQFDLCFIMESLQLAVGKWKSSHVSWLWLIWIIFGTRWNASASWSCSTMRLHHRTTTTLHSLLLLLLFAYASSNLFICLFSLISVQSLINYNFYCHDLRLGPHSRLRTSIFRSSSYL